MVQWHENMTSSVKPEVHNASERRQKRIEPRPLATGTENLVKCGRTVFELRVREDRQTYSSQYFATLTGRSKKNNISKKLSIRLSGLR